MNIAVYCGSNPESNPIFVEAARQLGTWIGESGNALVYGGSSIGLMGAVSKATLDAGGEAFGVEPGFFIEAGVAQHDLTELYVVETMAERRLKMIELADVFVALPGGVGTLEEISEIMSRIRLRMSPEPCFLLNLNGFYDGIACLLDEMVRACFLDQPTRDAFVFAESVEDLTARLARFEAKEPANGGRPIVPETQTMG